MYGYGYSYPNNPQGSGLMGRYEAGVRSDGGSFAFPIDTGLASRLEGLGLLNASSLVNSCNAGKESVMYNLIPTPVQSLDRFAVTRSTVKWVLGANGVLTSIPANTPAFEYNTDGTYRGLLVEPAGTNLQTYSQDFRNIAEGGATNTWSPNDTLILSTNNTAPDGTLTATRIRGNGANRARQASITGTSGAPYTASFFIRRVSGTGTLNIRVGDVGQTATVNPTTTWQRFSHTASPTTTTVRIAVVFTNDTDEFEIWGAQLETGPVATSYIPTVASTQTRTADSVTLTGASSLIGQTSGTAYVEFERQNFASTTVARLFNVSDGGTTNRILLFVDGTTSNGVALVTTGGALQAQITRSVATSGLNKFAIGYALNDIVFYANGSSVGTDTSATIPACSRVNIGTLENGTGGVDNFLGWIRSVVLFTTRIPNATLATLTS